MAIQLIGLPTTTSLGVSDLFHVRQGATDKTITKAALVAEIAPDASATVKGVIEIATQGEVDAKTSTTLAITPATLWGTLPSATTSIEGMAELATQTEVNAGDSTRIVTGATLAGRTATESRAGVIGIATQAETNTGTDDTRAITPEKQANSNFTAKAWVNFNGTGAVAIRDSLGVDSVTDNGVGDFTINITSGVMNTADYCASGMAQRPGSGSDDIFINYESSGVHTPTTTAARMLSQSGDGTEIDCTRVEVIFFGGQ